MPAPNEITCAQLLRLIGTPDCPRLVDVSLDEDFEADPFLIPSAARWPHTELAPLAKDLPDGSRVILICQKGGKLSQGAAAWLQSEGLSAHFLSGGNQAWQGLTPSMRIPVDALPAGTTPTLWVTRHRPKIDRIACPWLIRRFVDPNAKFLFVAPAHVAEVADRFDATPFDVENTFWSHRGDQCTFDTMLDEFGLRSPALDRLASVIRAADTNRHDLDPVAAGLLALSVGLSRQYKDDSQQLEAGLPLYDALYRWARDGQDEGHTWPTHGGHKA